MEVLRKMKNTIFIRNKDISFRIIESEAVILTPENGFLHTLDGTGTFIWQLLDGKNTVEDIIEKLCEEYDVKPEVAKIDVHRFIQDLLSRSLISPKKSRK